MNLLYVLTAVLFMEQLLDWWSTHLHVTKRGGQKDNKFVRNWIFKRMDMDLALGIKTVLVTAVGWWIGAQIIEMLAAIVVFYAGILIYNFRSI